jgi:hypothetical protein
MKNDYLLEWDRLDLRVRGAKVQQIVCDLLREKNAPVSDLRLKFIEGELQVSAKIQKGVTVPVKLTVRRITLSGKTVRLVLEDIATFGILPVPKLLFQIVGSRQLPAGIQFDPKTLTLTVAWHRFLPEFVDITIESIQLIRGGLALHLGKGAAGFPGL